MPGWPLPTYMCWAADHGSSNELFISGMPIDGIAGIVSVTVTCASGIGFPSAPVSVAWKALSSPAFSGLLSACEVELRRVRSQLRPSDGEQVQPHSPQIPSTRHTFPTSRS